MKKILVASLLALWTSVGVAAQWTPDPDRSRFGFVATYEGAGFKANFGQYKTSIQFDPSQLDTSAIEVTVNLVSVDSASADRDEGMQDSEWFDVAKHPQATFVSTGFSALGGDQFEVSGNLTIKDITRPIVIPFTWEATANEARFNGETVVKRTDFKIGTGEWEKDETIGFDVKIVVALVLTR
ncbi:MAG: YceI family protein [Gammaproteobacteria bacterium]|nr:YceI family protein [Gammaproteobacteria bacterium]